MKDKLQLLEGAFRALQEMEVAEGSNAKKAILKLNEDNTVLRDLCFAAYGGDKFNSYPTVQFDDVKEWKHLEPEAIGRYDDFRPMLLNLRDRNVSGDAAVELLNSFMDSCSPQEKKWYRRVLEHDLKIGMHTSFNKLWDFKLLSLDGKGPKEGDIVFPGVMLCEKNPKLIEKWGVDEFFVEPKLDGMRLLFVLASDGSWSFFSRQGKNARYNDNLKHIAEDILKAFKKIGIDAGCLDGEIMGVDWNSTLAVKRKTLTEQDLIEIQRCYFHAFDVFTDQIIEAKSVQKKRRNLLERVCAECLADNKDTRVKLNSQFVCSTLDEAFVLTQKFLLEGYEGAIAKSPNTFYQVNNKRSRDWIKLKPVDTQDVRVTGVYEGEARSRNEGRLGGFNVTDMKGQEFRVGGGFTDIQREQFWKDREKYIGQWMEIEFQPDPKQVAKGRFPVFTRWREDLE